MTFETGYGNSSTPLVQISDNNLSGDAATHFRNVTVNRPERFRDRWPLCNRGVGPRVAPVTEQGVPIYLHDYFGPGRHAKVVSTASPEFRAGGSEYQTLETVTGNEAKAAEVTDLEWPRLLDPVDDQPPATVVLQVRRRGDRLQVQGIAHDNGQITSVKVNGTPARLVDSGAGVVDWSVELEVPGDGNLTATAADAAGNQELTPHVLRGWTAKP